MKKQFIKYGDIFTQIHEEGGWYIYERKAYKMDEDYTYISDKKALSNIKPHFEIIKPMVRNSRSKTSKFQTTGEFYPSPMDWGILGFTVRSKERAFEKLKELLNE